MKAASGKGKSRWLTILADPDRALELMYHEAGHDIRLLDVDAAAAARHDPDIAAGLHELHRERHTWIRDAISDVTEPDVVAIWLVFACPWGSACRRPLAYSCRTSTICAPF
ncbi:hypothetical protein [Nocardia sp. alder85J]|uniref:hypothetical protein n=1 Tax=Nocardia sp. alder85J TaxID=2862949 RepID=UPI001CD36AD8|nr:hypothetical protein [Nocardia sp. alder85J]MCX4098408.1 hypothetical protein [Nocardia sp. alder85J]